MKFESIWISLVTFLFFRMRVEGHVTFTTRGRYIYCTLPLLSWWWWSLPQDMIILMIIWWGPFLHRDYHWKDLSQKYFYCFDSNQHNDEPPGIPLMDSEDKELKWSDDEIIVTILYKVLLHLFWQFCRQFSFSKKVPPFCCLFVRDHSQCKRTFVWNVILNEKKFPVECICSRRECTVFVILLWRSFSIESWWRQAFLYYFIA